MYKNLREKQKTKERFYSRYESLRKLFEEEKTNMNIIEKKKFEKVFKVFSEANRYLGS